MPLRKPNDYALGSVDNNRATLIKTTSGIIAPRTIEISKIATGKGSSKAVRALVGCYQAVPGSNVRAGVSISMQVPVGVETPPSNEQLSEMAFELIVALTTATNPSSDLTKADIVSAVQGVAAGVITPV